MTAPGDGAPVPGRTRDTDERLEEVPVMASATDVAHAGLHGWRGKLGDVVSGPVSSRTTAREEHVRALIGASFFVLSVVYIVKAAREAARIRADR
jgi:hypothetical protein